MIDFRNFLKNESLIAQLPIALALILLVVGGIFLLDKAASQARDTTRKHHLEDLEQALFFAREVKGTYPPYDKPQWCGLLSAAGNEDVKTQVEAVLREQNAKYAVAAKPFPVDPQYGAGEQGYFYWKHSPALFELYSVLEIDKNGDRNTTLCDNAVFMQYDYGLNSAVRESL